ncbi:MAG TPA: antibiotic biosynthesis monooxygenase [Gemmatimonadaceae bacterium]|nr:antibiotic biosynthesis monooxygenase [Gemmatimonadaceae bacterium]
MIAHGKVDGDLQNYQPPDTFAVSVFIFISHLTVPVVDHAELERHFRQRARLVDGFPGFLYLQLLKPQAGDATHTFLTAWRDREAFRAYMASVEHATSHSREPAEIMSRTAVRHEAFEVLMDSRARPEWVAAEAADVP